MSVLEGKSMTEICNLMMLQQRIKEYSGIFRIEDSNLICIYCKEKVNHKRKRIIQRHTSSKSHLRNYKMVRAKLVTVNENYESNYNDDSNSDGESDDEWMDAEKGQNKKRTLEERIQRYLVEFGSFLKREGKNLICVVCNHKIKRKHKTTIQRHFCTKIHQRNVYLKSHQENSIDTPIPMRKTTSSIAQKEFNIDLCKVFLVAGISFSKLSHPLVQKFFTTYTTMQVPDESTLRKNYLGPARATMQAEAEKIKQERLARIKKPGIKGKKSLKRKRKETSDDEDEDPLNFTDEQLESILQLKDEPKEESIDEPDENSLLLSNKNPGDQLSEPKEELIEPKLELKEELWN